MQADRLRRREFITLLGGAAAALPLVARAQQPAMPVIGFLHSGAADVSTHLAAGFRQGLSEAGHVDGRDVAIEYRWAEGRYHQLEALVAELVGRRVAVIFAGSLPTALAAKTVTSSIPIVFVSGADPVEFGLVASLGRPCGNATGVSSYYGALGAKRLELLRELVTNASLIGILSNPKNPNAEKHLADVQEPARAIGQQTVVFKASTEGEIDAAFAGFVRQAAGALLVADDPYFNSRREQLVRLAFVHALPAIYYAREFAEAGGLISYGSVSSNNYREAGVYVGRILRGVKPADLPVLQPTKFELVINLRTAKALGLEVPPMLLALADEVIE